MQNTSIKLYNLLFISITITIVNSSNSITSHLFSNKKKKNQIKKRFHRRQNKTIKSIINNTLEPIKVTFRKYI